MIWQLGGKASSFTLNTAPGQVLDGAGELFAWQHDPEALGHGIYTWFDNESSGNPLLPASRAITVKLDERARTATLIAADNQPEGRAPRHRATPRPSDTGCSLAGDRCRTSRSSIVRGA